MVRKPIVTSFVKVFQNWKWTEYCFAIVSDNKVMFEQIDFTFSFGSLFKNIPIYKQFYDIHHHIDVGNM